MICRICGKKCVEFLDLGQQPVANNFVTKDQFESELFYHLTVLVCLSCLTIQLGEQVDAEKVFNKDYTFYTGTSQVMTDHFLDLARLIKADYLPNDPERKPVIVEIGSNDGTFLQHFVSDKYIATGFEPSGSVAKVARSRGVKIEGSRFETANLKGQPTADVVVSTNTFAHIPDREGVLKNIANLLSPHGVWINEEPYFGEVIRRLAFDQFYNEHGYYTSINSMITTLLEYGMCIKKIEFVSTHGGSIRYYIGRGTDNSDIQAFLIRSLGNTFEADTVNCLLKFGADVRLRIKQLRDTIIDIGKPIIGYGAPAKMSTLTVACDLGPDIITKTYDNTPAKIGKFSPGKHIPVVDSDGFRDDKTKNVLLFAWNHKAEILAKESAVELEKEKLVAADKAKDVTAKEKKRSVRKKATMNRTWIVPVQEV